MAGRLSHSSELGGDDDDLAGAQPGRKGTIARGTVVSNALASIDGEDKAQAPDLTKDDFAFAKEYMRDLIPGRGNRSLWRTDHEDIGQWGVGIQLYFEFTYYFGWFSLVLALLYVPLFALCVAGDSLRRTDTSRTAGLGEYAVLSTIPNMGILHTLDGAMANSTMALVNVNGTNTTFDITSTLFDSSLEYERRTYLFGFEVDIRTITFAMGVLDAIGSLLLFFMAWRFEFRFIPEVVMRHRSEFPTTNMYAIFVDYIPRRVFRGGGHDHYGIQLRQHFELLLEAQVSTMSATVGMQVVHTRDHGHDYEEPKRWCRCCPKRSTGYDAKGRRLGKIVKMRGGHCYVMWSATADDPAPKPTKCKLSTGEDESDLLDVALLRGLEAAGLEPVPFAARDSTNCSVYSVSLQRDFESKLTKMKEDQKQADRSFEGRLRRLQKGLKKGIKKGAKKAKKALRLQRQRDLMMELDFDSKIPLEERDVVGAFLIFNNAKHRDFIWDLYRFTRTPLRPLLIAHKLKFGHMPTRVNEAPPPSDVFWDNLDYPRILRAQAKALSTACIMLIIGAITVLVAHSRTVADDAKSDSSTEESLSCTGNFATDHPECICVSAGFRSVFQDEPPGIRTHCSDWLERQTWAGVWAGISLLVAVMAKFVAGNIVKYLARWERPLTLTDMNSRITSLTTIMSVLIVGLIRVLINAKWPFTIFGVFGGGEYEHLDPGWYVDVGAPLVVTMLLNSIYPLAGAFQTPRFHLQRRFCKRRKALLTDLLDLYTPKNFPFALRHADQMTQLLLTLIFCGGMPALAMFLPMSFFLFYWSDKYTLLRGSQTPPRYNENVMITMIHSVQVGVFLHCSFTCWVYANSATAPSYDVIHSNLKLFGISVSQRAQGDRILKPLLEKMFVLSSMPSALVSAIVGGILLVRLILFFLKSSAHALLHHEELGEALDSFRNELPGMKRLHLGTTYDIYDRPGYEFLEQGGDQKNIALKRALGLQVEDDDDEWETDSEAEEEFDEETGERIKKLRRAKRKAAGVARLGAQLRSNNDLNAGPPPRAPVTLPIPPSLPPPPKRPAKPRPPPNRQQRVQRRAKSANNEKSRPLDDAGAGSPVPRQRPVSVRSSPAAAQRNNATSAATGEGPLEPRLRGHVRHAVVDKPVRSALASPTSSKSSLKSAAPGEERPADDGSTEPLLNLEAARLRLETASTAMQAMGYSGLTSNELASSARAPKSSRGPKGKGRSKKAAAGKSKRSSENAHLPFNPAPANIAAAAAAGAAALRPPPTVAGLAQADDDDFDAIV